MSIAADSPLTEPTDPQWDTEYEEKELTPWYDPTTGFSQEPFLAAPEGFVSPIDLPPAVRYHAFISGVGAGKTVAGIIRTIANMEEWNPGQPGMIIGPTVPHLKNAILPEMRKWGLLDIYEYHGKGSDTPGLIAPNGSRAILESADNDRKIDRLRGPSLAWVWIDEAAHLPKKVWDVLIARLRAGRYRNAYITTTPNGFNWVYDRFYTYEENGRVVEGAPDDVNIVYGVPSTANPMLPDDYGDITGEYQGHFRDQEVLGLFVQPEGLVYPMFGEDHLVESPPPNPGRVFYGVDWGFFPNPGAIVCWIETRTGELYAVEEFSERRCTDTDMAEVANEMVARWGPGTFYCDPSEPDSIEVFNRHGLDAVGADNDVSPGIKSVTSAMSRIKVRRACTDLIGEFNQYHYPDDASEEDDVVPVKKNDHLMDASRYAIHSHDMTGSHSTGVVSGDMYR
jgi:PBSX family phage terminase large subunit